METKEIVLYRHKTNKDFYLMGNTDGNVFEATDDINMALGRARCGDGTNIIEELKSKVIKGEDTPKVTAIEYKHFEIDGYEGTLTKINTFNVDDFEPITLVIKEDLEQKENQK